MTPLGDSKAEFIPDKYSHLQYLAVTVVIAVWQGMIGVLVKWSTWPPVTMVWARCVVTVLALAAFSHRFPSPPTTDAVTPGRMRAVTWASGALLAAHWVALFWGYRVCNVGPVVVALFTFPVMAALVEPWFFAKRPQLLQLTTACVATFGVAGMWLWESDDTASATNPGLGIGLGLSSAAFYAARSIIARKLLRHSSASKIMRDQAVVVAVILLPSVLFLETSHLTAREFAWALVLGVGFTAVPHTLGVWSMKKLSVATSGIVGSLQTISTLFLAQILVGELISPSVWIGACVVLLAVAIESAAHARVFSSR